MTSMEIKISIGSENEAPCLKWPGAKERTKPFEE